MVAAVVSPNSHAVRLLCCGLIATLAVWFHSPAIGFGFLYYDDPFYVTENAMVKDGVSWPGLVWAFTSLQGFYHPVTWLSLMLDVQFLGYSPASFHLTNVLLHAANACLVFLVADALKFRTPVALLAAAIFVLHPLNVEPVAWISERKGLLAAFFGLSTVLLHIRSLTQRSFGIVLLTALAYSLGLLSKASIITLPLLLVVLDLWLLRRKLSLENVLLSFRDNALLFCMAVAMIPLTLQSEIHAGAYSKPLSGWAVPIHAMACYVRAFLLPTTQGISYRDLEFFAVDAYPAALVMLAAVGAWTWRFHDARRPTVLCTLWFLILMFPVSGIVPISTHVAADRYLYLPGVGLTLLLVFDLESAARSCRLGLVGAVIAGAALCWFWIDEACRRELAWSDDVSLCRATLQYDSQNVIALNNLAWAISQEHPSPKEAREAVRIARQAASLTQFRDPNVLGTLAASHASAKDFRSACRVAHQAILLAEHLKIRELIPLLTDQRLEYDRRLQALAAADAGVTPSHVHR